ncbi:hypothetical protein TNCV_374771 [Trichonephila clavipes]|nr:hypothetical protein TNCV_374771 [Trichonephila clavipes]
MDTQVIRVQHRMGISTECPKRCRGRFVQESSRQYGRITNFVRSFSSPRLKLPRTTHSRAKGRSLVRTHPSLFRKPRRWFH